MPTSEALHWIYATYEIDKGGRTHGAAKRDFLLLDNGELVLALAYLRGQQIHDFIELAGVEDLYPSQDLFPSDDLTPGQSWRWKLGLEAGWTSPLGIDRAPMYRDHVAQQGVAESLEVAARSLFP